MLHYAGVINRANTPFAAQLSVPGSNVTLASEVQYVPKDYFQ